MHIIYYIFDVFLILLKCDILYAYACYNILIIQ